MTATAWWRVAAAVVAGGITVVATADAATAEVDGNCEATLAGEDVGSRSSTEVDDAIDVGADDVVEVGATSSAPIDSYTVDMEFAGFSWEVASGEADGNSWSDEVDVADYARFGVGLYRVTAESQGEGACSGAVLVNITGKSPFTTAAGIGATAVGVLGAVLISSSLSDALKGGKR